MMRTTVRQVFSGQVFLSLALVGGLTAVLSTGGCTATGVGDPCTPEQEFNSDFLGFNRDEVNVESKSFQCQTRLCLVNHFQGRVTCPYGQGSNGEPPAGAQACRTPAGKAVDGKDKDGQIVDSRNLAQVNPQCRERTTNQAVYCSCRCANSEGRTDDGASYCTCPDGFSCQQLVNPIGALNEGLTGGYCVKKGTEYDKTQACTGCKTGDKECDATGASTATKSDGGK